jgi:hypothetical protein
MRKEPTELPNAFCPRCNTLFVLTPAHFATHFGGAEVRCGYSHCTKSFNLWADMVQHVGDADVFGTALRFAGARTVMVTVPIGFNEVKQIDLSEHGVPQDADIIALVLQPEGGGNAAVLHGRHALPDRIRGPRFVLFAQPFISVARGREGSVKVNATWFVRRGDDTTIRHVVDAARRLSEGQFDDVVVPANIAVEAAISPVVERALEGPAGKAVLGLLGDASSQSHVQRFLDDKSKIAHRVNALAPIIARLAGAPTLPRELLGVLNRLRDLRNEVAHDGKCAAQSRQDAAEHLAGAVFALRYAELLEAAVTEARRTGRMPLP